MGARRVLTPRLTHFVWPDTPGGPTAVVSAICGASLRKREAVGDPTCAECIRLRVAFDAMEIGGEGGAP